MSTTGHHKIYLASSRRNELQPKVLAELRALGHIVYDFKNPDPADPLNAGFSWPSIDPNWKDWGPEQLAIALNHPIAIKGHHLDHQAMTTASACVLLLPAGSSAHLEAGYCAGRGIPTVAYAPAGMRDPELMYRSLPFRQAPGGHSECLITGFAHLTSWLQRTHSERMARVAAWDAT